MCVAWVSGVGCAVSAPRPCIISWYRKMISGTHLPTAHPAQRPPHLSPAPVRVWGFDDSRYTPVLVTPWSLVHLASGVIAFACVRAAGLTPVQGALVWQAVHGLYEAKDVYLAYTGGGPKNRLVDNSWHNSVIDHALATAGYAAMSYLAPHLSIPLSVWALLAAYAVVMSPMMSPTGHAVAAEDAWRYRG
jgi:hypothetical protein